MYSVSRKEINNIPTGLILKDNKTIFMSRENQIFLTKKMYRMHKNNHGLSTYLHFKDLIPNRMRQWISNKKINQSRDAVLYGIDMLNYLNDMFIRDNADVYTFKPNEHLENVPDKNVYKGSYTIAHYADNDGDIYFTQKKPTELLADDIRNLDVWGEQTTYVSNENMRYNNQIPYWQKNMNIRHYDRGNEGYRASVKNSSLEGKLNGYKYAMDELVKLSQNKLKKENNIDRYF